MSQPHRTCILFGDSTAKVVTESSLNPQNIYQSISWMLTGAVSNDSPVPLNRRRTTEPALKVHGQQTRITDAAVKVSIVENSTVLFNSYMR